MRVWKLVSGILSIILFAVVMFQSCAAGVVNALEDNGGISGSVGVIVGILMLAGGIVSIATRNKTGKGHDIALIVLFGLAVFRRSNRFRTCCCIRICRIRQLQRLSNLVSMVSYKCCSGSCKHD